MKNNFYKKNKNLKFVQNNFLDNLPNNVIKKDNININKNKINSVIKNKKRKKKRKRKILKKIIRNDYNLDKIENEINRTDSIADFDDLYQQIKRNNNIYIDDDRNTKINSDINHYEDNFLEKRNAKRNKSMFVKSSISTKLTT